MTSERLDVEHEPTMGALSGDDATSPEVASDSMPRRRRAGLGRRLDEVIETHDSHAGPAHLVAATPPVPSSDGEAVVNVAVVETLDGVRVEVRGAGDVVISAPVIGSLDDAVVRATMDLLDIDPRWDVAVAGTRTRHGEVVVVTAGDGRGTTMVGAADVEFGRPWAIARAIVAMLDATPMPVRSTGRTARSTAWSGG